MYNVITDSLNLLLRCPFFQIKRHICNCLTDYYIHTYMYLNINGKYMYVEVTDLIQSLHDPLRVD